MSSSVQDPQFPDLNDASVFVTGGGSGIGAALVDGFAAQGARVAFIDLHVPQALGDRLAGAHAHKPLGIEGDVRDVAALRDAIDRARGAHGPIRVLVNNAAKDSRHRLADWSVADWDDAFAVNLRPHFFSAQAVAPDMRGLGGGAIVNLSSNSYLLGLDGYPGYVTAKAGILGLTRALARELGPDGIRVNSLLPGWVMTERQRELWASETALAECLDQQCLKEAIAVEDLIGPCLFLASQASRMMTGQSLVIDGGRA